MCSPKTVSGFSATAYFFGRELHKQLKVPVGLINSSVGGTPIQSWTGVKAQQDVPELAPIIENLKKAIATYDPEAAKERFEKQMAEWKTSLEAAQGEARR